MHFLLKIRIFVKQKLYILCDIEIRKSITEKQLSLLLPLFSLEKKGILILYQSLSFVRLSVHGCVRVCVCYVS